MINILLVIILKKTRNEKHSNIRFRLGFINEPSSRSKKHLILFYERFF